MIIKEFLNRPPDAYLFSPHEAHEEQYKRWRAARKSPVPPSPRNRRTASRRKTIGDRYGARSYHGAIQHACERASVEPWHPHQLRHTHATEIQAPAFGIEAAQVALGHASADVTQVYAERDLRLAIKIAETEG